MIPWEIHGWNFSNCNCAYGCPCQFNALPTYSDCQTATFYKIDRGHFGGQSLDGQTMAFVVKWPGPIHEGKGILQPIINEAANEAQRQVLLAIMTAQETEEMATGFCIYAGTSDTILDPIFTRLDVEIDMHARTAQCEARGVVTSRGEPIRNAVSGSEHRVGIVMPNGLDFTFAEMGRGWSEATGAVTLKLEDSYGSWSEVHVNNAGLMERTN